MAGPPSTQAAASFFAGIAMVVIVRLLNSGSLAGAMQSALGRTAM
jgi:hypothetical protein